MCDEANSDFALMELCGEHAFWLIKWEIMNSDLQWSLNCFLKADFLLKDLWNPSSPRSIPACCFFCPHLVFWASWWHSQYLCSRVVWELSSYNGDFLFSGVGGFSLNCTAIVACPSLGYCWGGLWPTTWSFWLSTSEPHWLAFKDLFLMGMLNMGQI